MRRHRVARMAAALVVAVLAACSDTTQDSDEENHNPPTTAAADFCLDLQQVRETFGLKDLEGPTSMSDVRCEYRADVEGHEATASWGKPIEDKTDADTAWLNAQQHAGCTIRCHSDEGTIDFRNIGSVAVVTTLQDFNTEQVVHVNAFLRTGAAFCSLGVSPESGSDPNPYEVQAAQLIQEVCPT